MCNFTDPTERPEVVFRKEVKFTDQGKDGKSVVPVSAGEMFGSNLYAEYKNAFGK
jgi:hypothetical protein